MPRFISRTNCLRGWVFTFLFQLWEVDPREWGVVPLNAVVDFRRALSEDKMLSETSLGPYINREWETVYPGVLGFLWRSFRSHTMFTSAPASIKHKPMLVRPKKGLYVFYFNRFSFLRRLFIIHTLVIFEWRSALVWWKIRWSPRETSYIFHGEIWPDNQLFYVYEINEILMQFAENLLLNYSLQYF